MTSFFSGHGLKGVLSPIRVIKLHSTIGIVPENYLLDAGGWRLEAGPLNYSGHKNYLPTGINT